jgi:hypothetical protein
MSCVEGRASQALLARTFGERRVSRVINLVLFDILTSPVFRRLPPFDEVFLKGRTGGLSLVFAVRRGEEAWVLVSAAVIRQDERFLWESCQDLLNQGLLSAAGAAHGVFTFELISFDVHREIGSFRVQELAELIANHSRRLAVGQESFVKYSSCFGSLKKIADEDWGKFILKSAIHTFDQPPAKLDLFIKQLLRVPVPAGGTKWILIQDYSRTPLLEPDNLEQKERLAKLLHRQPDLFQETPRIVMNDVCRTTDLV